MTEKIISKESKENKSKRLRKTVIRRHRKNRNLCLFCGQDPHNGEDCNPTYEKTDMRNSIIEKKVVDFNKKQNTILIYRIKKKLCPLCGKEPHESECDKDWSKADNRTDEEKKDRPAIIKTPKSKSKSILESLKEEKKVERVDLQKTESVDLQRKFIIINLRKSTKGNIIEHSCLFQLSKKYKDYIICIIGCLEKAFPYSDLIKIKKIPNIIEVRNASTQRIINYICSCKIFFGFKSEFTEYCLRNSIPVYIFEEGKNATNFLKDSAFMI